jgi:hypothetical protein
MVKKTGDVTRQHRTLDRERVRELGDWLILRAGANADGLLRGTRPAIATAATEALGIDVSPSSITTVAEGCKLKFARSEAAIKRKKQKAAPRVNDSQRQAQILRNICDQLTDRLPGFQLSAKDTEALADMLKTPAAAAVEIQQPPVAVPVTEYPGLSYMSSAIAAAQGVEIARLRAQQQQPMPRWPPPTVTPQGTKQAELPFQEPQ